MGSIKNLRKSSVTVESLSASLSTDRKCTMEITNSSSFCLVNPKVHIACGYCFHPPQPTVRTTDTEVCSFTKDDNTATGAVGLLTYDLLHVRTGTFSEHVAVMSSVPLYYNLYKNWFGVGMFEAAFACDKNLYKRMYSD